MWQIQVPADWLTEPEWMNEWLPVARAHTHTHFMMMMIIIMTGILPIIFFLLYLFKNWKDDLIWWWWWWWKWNCNLIFIFFTSLTLKLKNFFPKRSHGGNGMKYNLALFFLNFKTLVAVDLFSGFIFKCRRIIIKQQTDIL